MSASILLFFFLLNPSLALIRSPYHPRASSSTYLNAEPASSSREKWPLSRFLSTLQFFRPSALVSALTLSPPPPAQAPRSRIVVVGAPSDPATSSLLRTLGQQLRYAVAPLSSVVGEEDAGADVAAVILVDSALRTRPDNDTQMLPSLLRSLAGRSTLPLYSARNASSWSDWGALDDVVMGGVSSSSIAANGSTVLFAGRVSTSNSGGFSSVRSRNRPTDLSRFLGIQLSIRSRMDSLARFKMILRDEEAWDGIAWCFSFDAPPSAEFIDIRIPFKDFKPVRRSSSIAADGGINAAFINSFQLMYSKFEYDKDLNPHFSAGEFCLEIGEICAYAAENVAPQILLLSSGHMDIESLKSLQDRVLDGRSFSTLRYGRSSRLEMDESIRRAVRRFL